MAEQILLYPFKNRIVRGDYRTNLKQWLEFVSPDIVKFEDDFIGKVDTTLKWGSITSGSGAAVTGTVASTNNGICRLTTGADTEGYAAIFPNQNASLEGAAFVGDNSPVIWVRILTSSALTFKIEIGFTDADDDAGAVNILATPSTRALDCAVWCYDTNDASELFWQGVHSISSTTPSKVKPGLFLPVATTYEWLGVAILGDAVKFMRADQYGNPTYESAWQPTGITAGIELIPWIFAQTRVGGASKTIDIDYVIAYQRRTSTDD